jgi:hypothetical protein
MLRGSCHQGTMHPPVLHGGGDFQMYRIAVNILCNHVDSHQGVVHQTGNWGGGGGGELGKKNSL